MRYSGIDIGSDSHVVAVVDADGGVLVKPTRFGEDVVGYDLVQRVLGDPGDVFVAMEATGHYWRNLFTVGYLAQGSGIPTTPIAAAGETKLLRA